MFIFLQENIFKTFFLILRNKITVYDGHLRIGLMFRRSCICGFKRESSESTSCKTEEEKNKKKGYTPFFTIYS